MIRWCPRCKIEVGADRGRCPQCMGSLDVPPLPTEPPPEGLELAVFESGSVSWIQSVSAGLRSAGIRHWIAYGAGEDVDPRGSFGHGTAIDLLVAVCDVEPALAARDRVIRSEVPDIPAESAPEGSCPACGFAPLAPEMNECPDCELAIPTYEPG